MDILLRPHVLEGTLTIPSSKSDVHRLLICAALADRPTCIRFSGLCEDIQATFACLQVLGAELRLQSGCWNVLPRKDSTSLPAICNCKESGSTLRFLLPVAAALGMETQFLGEGRLPHRPLGPLLSEMERHGCTFSEHMLPFRLSGALTPGQYSLPGDVSSQFISGLLFALPLLKGDSILTLTSPLESRSYVNMTLSTLKQFGIAVEVRAGAFFVPGNQTYRSPGTIMADGDWSNAAFWLCAGALGRPVTCRGLLEDSLQGDRVVLSLLKKFGAQVDIAGTEVTVSPGKLSAIELDASEIPDLVPALSVVATAAAGTTSIRHAGRLRLKESDRLLAICTGLTALGAHIDESAEGLYIRGGQPLSGGYVEGYRDHRIVMAMAIASLLCKKDVLLRGTEAVQKSYPDFFRDFEKLGGDTHVIQHRR